MDFELSVSDKLELIHIAECAIKERFFEDICIDPPIGKAKLYVKCGCFVTLHMPDGSLRGCIGNFRDDIELYKNVSEMAVAAAFDDPRFSPVTLAEVKKITLEISVLTPPQNINSFDDIIVGRDGVIVNDGENSGVFLPQVATEQGWDIDMLLSQLCVKAGLPKSFWQANVQKFSKFTAIVFSKSSLATKS